MEIRRIDGVVTDEGREESGLDRRKVLEFLRQLGGAGLDLGSVGLGVVGPPLEDRERRLQ
ncbi:hypothetical protein D3C71_2010200 [compost metagenome]